MIFDGQDTVYTVCLHFSKALVSKVGSGATAGDPQRLSTHQIHKKKSIFKKFQCIPVNIQLQICGLKVFSPQLLLFLSCITKCRHKTFCV